MAWDTDDSTGLLAHFIGTVKESIWTTDSEKQDPDAAFLHWTVTVDDAIQSNFQGEIPDELSVNITCGKGWVDDEEGATVEHKEGLEMFKSSSVYGKIVGMVAGKESDYGDNAEILDGGPAPKFDFKGVAKHMQANGHDDPRVAAIWNGLQFEFRGIGFRYRGTKGQPFQQVLPVRLAGVGEVEAAPKAASKSAKEPVDTTPIWLTAGADAETADTLNDLVNSSKNHAAFAKQAVLLAGVKDNDELRFQVLESANFPS